MVTLLSLLFLLAVAAAVARLLYRWKPAHSRHSIHATSSVRMRLREGERARSGLPLFYVDVGVVTCNAAGSGAFLGVADGDSEPDGSVWLAVRSEHSWPLARKLPPAWGVPLALLLLLASCASNQQSTWRAAALEAAPTAPAMLAAASADGAPCTARVANFAGARFVGWHRVNVEGTPTPAVGRTASGIDYVVGRATGASTVAVDLWLDLQPGQELVVDFAGASSRSWTLPLPPDPVAHFGGDLTFCGQPMAFLTLQPDGAAWSALFRARSGRMLVCDLWARFYPQDPSVVHAEAFVVASNPAVPDMGEQLQQPAQLAWGDAVQVLPGRPFNAPVVAAGEYLADGQGRVVPLLFVWLRHVQTVEQFGSRLAQAQLGVCGHGVRQLLHTGTPAMPPTFSARAWARDNVGEAARRLTTWDWLLFGPSARSGDTGGQEEQVFSRGEPLRPDGVGAELVVYLSACKLAERPCHYREVDGSPLLPEKHTSPRLVLWDMRPHWHTGVSPDRLGKPRDLSVEEAHGRLGADVEHWLQFTLCAANRYTGRPAIQHLLEVQARNYRLQWTVTPGWSTTQPYAARAIGWEAAMAVAFSRELSDVVLRQQSEQHWLQRWSGVIRPWLDANPDYWDTRNNDPRLGPGLWWMPWQQSVGAYFLDVAGERWGNASMRSASLRAARRVVAEAWVQRDGVWLTRPQCPVVGWETAPADGSFNYFGMALAVATVLRHEPENPRARSIWQQLLNGAGNNLGNWKWLAPELVPAGMP